MEMMKRILLIGMIMLTSASLVRAETEFSPGVVLGFGVSSPRWLTYHEGWQDFPTPEDLKEETHFNVGGKLEISPSEKFSIEIDCLYNGMGWSYYLNYGDPASRPFTRQYYTFLLRRLSFPLLFKAKLPLGRVVPFLGIGPEIGIVLSNKATVNTTIFYEDDKIETEVVLDWTEHTKVEHSSTGDLTFCGGTEIRAGAVDLFLELRYRLCLGDITSIEKLSFRVDQLLLLWGVEF